MYANIFFFLFEYILYALWKMEVLGKQNFYKFLTVLYLGDIKKGDT